ncbi:hypothetical protein Pcinc_043223 [Petrolisthes cinctipes]|uniref:Uncharacterized protein n=1 Tax=Petrolisthes cinctipes TaxID=88211 RepID=A0AAE1BFZ6_PETCI|nr:hypothetical protein Pcinc_043223 [Petrolisthes cinctipes]
MTVTPYHCEGSTVTQANTNSSNSDKTTQALARPRHHRKQAHGCPHHPITQSRKSGRSETGWGGRDRNEIGRSGAVKSGAVRSGMG